MHRVLVISDIAALSLAFILSTLLFEPGAHVVSGGTESLVFILSLPLWVATAKEAGLYSRDHTRTDHSTVDDFVGVVAVITLGSWVYTCIEWLTHAVGSNPHRMIAFWLMAIGFVLGARVVGRSLARRSSLYVQRAVIVGAGSVGQLIGRKLVQHPEFGIRLVGFVDSSPKTMRTEMRDQPILGSLAELSDLVDRHEVDRVVIAPSGDSHEALIEAIRGLKTRSVHIDVVPRLFEVVGPGAELSTVEGLPLVGLRPLQLSPSSRVIKRTVDVVVASVGLVLTAPLFVYIACRIKRDSPGPVFFRQTRLGLNMKPFTTLKFRTMRVGANSSAHREYIKETMRADAPVGANGFYKLDGADTVTGFGRWLRRTSADELPQLINVLRGDMSIVGPRPCIPYETENFEPYHFERFLVPAGLTGLWQVTARSRASFGEALDMDVAYARGWSLGLDFRLLCRTPLAIARYRATT